VQSIFEGLSFNVKPAEETRDDPSLSHTTDAWHRHNQLAVEAPHSLTPDCSEDEISGTMESPGVLLGLEVEDARIHRPVDSYFLDPRQTAGAEQALRKGIQFPYKVVSEPQYISVLAAFEHLGLAQVGKGEVEVEGGVDH
jgi:hypothetical protein